ncbi:MAG: RraA family protein [Planctomycetia bacterium]|nr:RraA family protein [Planctomycetia bacterium]
MMRRSLYSAVVNDALDALGLRQQSPRVPLCPMTVSDLLVGRCKTTLWADMAHEVPDPYKLVLAAVDSCRADSVMIAAGNGSMRSAIWGELLSTAARASGCVGAIVDGAVRDVARVRAMSFAVYARGSSVCDCAGRMRVVDLDVPVEIGRVRFSPGDLVFADEDGVVVVPQAAEEDVIRHAWDKVHREHLVRDAIRAGAKATAAYEKHGVL